VRKDDTFRRWQTLQEDSHDRRTGATAVLTEMANGKWNWKVIRASGTVRGESASQKSARAAARRCVRKLPSADTKPDRQLDLFGQGRL